MSCVLYTVQCTLCSRAGLATIFETCRSERVTNKYCIKTILNKKTNSCYLKRYAWQPYAWKPYAWQPYAWQPYASLSFNFNKKLNLFFIFLFLQPKLKTLRTIIWNCNFMSDDDILDNDDIYFYFSLTNLQCYYMSWYFKC